MTQKKTPATVAADREGKTPKKGIEMFKNTVPQTTGIRDTADLRQAEWLREHADSVAAVQPAWADSAHTEVDFEDEEVGDAAEGVLFSRRVGQVAIEQMFIVCADGIEAADKPQIWEEVDGHAIAIDRAAHVGADLIKAAQIINGPGDVTATMFEIVGSALGISGTDLYALADVDQDPENEISLGDLFRMSRYVGLTPMALYNLAHRASPVDEGKHS